MFDAIQKYFIVRKWKANGRYSWNSFSEFGESFGMIYSYDLRPAYAEKVKRKTNLNLRTTHFYEFAKSMTLQEVKVIDFIYRKIFVKEETWNRIDRKYKIELIDKVWKCIESCYDRNMGTIKDHLDDLLLKVDRMMGEEVVELAVAVKEDPIKDKTLRNLIDRANSILLANPIYKHKCRTLIILIKDADTIRDETKKASIVKKLSEKLTEHENQFIHAPISEIEMVTHDVIEERLLTI